MSTAFGVSGTQHEDCSRGSRKITIMHQASTHRHGDECWLGMNRSPPPPLAPTRAARTPPKAAARPKSLQRLDESSDCASEDTCSVYSSFDSDDFFVEPFASFGACSEKVALCCAP